jgi:transcriptional regulator GlxA family with amidase domain
MDASADREWPLADLAGRGPAQALVRALQKAGSEVQRFAAAAAWVHAHGHQARAPADRAPAHEAIDRILAAHGQVRMEALARDLGWSPRRLERAFLRDLGIRPKLFARIVRLQAVLARLGEPQRAAAVDLALEAGYFDQAHLLHDFRALAGRRPSAGGDADGEMARHFTHPERLRALFAGD